MREWLKTVREKKGFSQLGLANKADIAPSHYNMIETGNRRPSVEVAKRIADVLGFEWTRFFENKESEEEVTL
ncbi:MAG: helix-turn-helix transcriptional regulator [Anaerofustis sp.]